MRSSQSLCDTSKISSFNRFYQNSSGESLCYLSVCFLLIQLILTARIPDGLTRSKKRFSLRLGIAHWEDEKQLRAFRMSPNYCIYIFFAVKRVHVDHHPCEKNISSFQCTSIFSQVQSFIYCSSFCPLFLSRFLFSLYFCLFFFFKRIFFNII